MHSRSITAGVLAAVCLLGVSPRPVRAEDPKKAPAEPARIPQQPQRVIERGLAFLEKDAVKWRKERGCATRHHGTMTVWALSEAKAQGYSVGAEVLAEMLQWTKDRFAPRSSEPQAPQPGSASVPLLYLGTMSQHLPILSRDEINRIAMHLAARQGEDGTWELPPPKNGPPPTWESRETVALLALLAWEPYVSPDAREAPAARASRDKTVAWLRKTKSTDTTQALTLRLLLDARRGTPEKQLQPGIDGLLKRQRADGGWRQINDLPSDAYATGQVLYALSFAGVKSDRPEIQRAVAFLAATQRNDGSWPMISRGHPGVKPFTNPVPITYFGSAWAMLGLVRSVPSPPDTAAKQRQAFDNILAFHGKYEVDEKSPGRPVIGVDLRYYEVSDKEVGDFTKVLRAFPRLTTLQFKSTKITDAGLTHLKGLPQLRTLALENATITDAGLAQLKGLTCLQVLNLKGTKVTDSGVQELLKALPRVTIDPPASKNDPPNPLPKALVEAWKEAGAQVCWLRMDKPGATSESGLGFLLVVPEKAGKPGDLPAFKFDRWHEGRLAKLPAPATGFGLYLFNAKVTDAELKELAGLKSLQTLFLFGTQVTDAGLKELAGLESLQALYLGRTRVTDAGLKELAGLKSLQTLNLFVTPVTDRGLKQLAGLKSLQTLSLDVTKVTDAGLKELAGLKSLQTLHLNSTPVTDAGLTELARLKSLRRLDLGGTQMSDAGLKELAGLTGLHALVVPRTRVADAGLKELAGLTNLQILNIRATRVTDAGLKELAALKNLQTLNLNLTRVTDAGLKELAALKSLQSLNLSYTRVTDAGLKEVAGLTSLQTLNLGGTQVSDAGLMELAALKGLRRLDLVSTKVTDAGLMELRKALPRCKISR